MARLLGAILPCVAFAAVAWAQPLDTYTCFTCDPRADRFRSGDYSALSEPIIDPACDCPFPNNIIPRSRLLPNGAWPEDIYQSNWRAFSGPAGSVARAVAQGFTPLLEALNSGSSRHPRRHTHPEELERLLDGLTQAEVNVGTPNRGPSSGWTALHYAVHRRQGTMIISLLLDSGAIVDARSDDGWTPLMQAWTLEDFGTLREAGADIRAKDDSGFTVLHIAAAAADAASVETLIALGLDPDAQTVTGGRPLHAAGSPGTFEALRRAGADIHAQTDSGFTVLHRAALWLDAASVEALIAAGLDPNAQTNNGVTPLLYARSRAKFEALLAGGADLGWIATIFAPDGLESFRQWQSSRQSSDRSVWYQAVRTVGQSASSSLVARLRGSNPAFAEVRDPFDRPPLYYAASYNEDPSMIAALSTSNLTATTRIRNGFLLHRAAQYNSNPAVIEALLAAGASIHVNIPQSGRTPLYLAASNGNPRAAEIVSVLLEAGADASGRDMNGEDTGNAPLYAAAMMQNVAAMELLLAAGAEVNITGSSEYQSLLADVLGRGRYDCGYGPVADALRAAGATSWRIVGDQRMPYVPGPPVAECETVSDKVRELIDSGGDLDALDSQGFTCLHLSAAAGKVVDIRALVAAGANVNAPTRRGRLTPLHVAIWKRAGLATVRALISAEADVNATDWFGQTALHRAARDSRTEAAVVEALLAAGADPNIHNSTYRTPLDHATRADVKNEEIADLLRDAGGTCRFCDAP